MDKEVLVYVDLNGLPCLTGRLWSHVRKGQESATFEYDKSWVDRADRFSLDPALQVGPGPFHSAADKPLFGAIGDSAPDRWGRTLMLRAERRRAKLSGTTPRSLTELDFLLMVNDEVRQGALRFTDRETAPFLADDRGSSIPPLIELQRLLDASGRVEDEEDTDEDLRLLLAPGSSLGGARPKASVRDRDGSLAIAKFPRKSDVVDMVRWEAVALALAERSRISVPTWRIEMVDTTPVLLLKRFDRAAGKRLPYLSAMSMLGASDNEVRSYMEIVDALTQAGAAPKDDKRELWRRLVFNVLVSNTDDHLRNFGFLYVGTEGWRLAPAYDLNPTPVDIKPRFLSTAIDVDDTTASLKLALEVSDYFELTDAEAHGIAAEVGLAVSSWREVAKASGLARSDVDRMASAFDHEDSALASRLSPTKISASHESGS